MTNVLSYHVLNGISGKWLDGDEKSWTSTFIDSAAFTDAKLAQDIGERETGPQGVIYVMACMGNA
jgi:hypothetical protein